MVEVDYKVWIDIASVIVETIIVILLIKTVRDYAEVAKVSRLQVKQRFRPWIGPITGIEFLKESDGKLQYAIAIKNFGEIPATNVIVTSVITNKLPTRSLAQAQESEQPRDGHLEKFILGPLLPNMEKRYWIFIESKMLQEARRGALQVYTFINFFYEYDGGMSSYGMISHYDEKSNIFIHKDMWIS